MNAQSIPNPSRVGWGPRFYDWQFARSLGAAVRERHLHARNLLGADDYARLIAGLIANHFAAGEDAFGMLNDRSVCGLIDEKGRVNVLVEIRARRLLDDDAFWTAAAALQDAGHPNADWYSIFSINSTRASFWTTPATVTGARATLPVRTIGHSHR